MKQYKISCKKCKLKLVLTADPKEEIKIDCEHCNGQIFPTKSLFQTYGGTVQYSPAVITPLEITKAVDENNFPTIDNYRITRKIGEGAFGEIYLGKHIDNPEKRVVFKFMKINSLPENQKSNIIDSFAREAEVLATLSHKYIVQFKGQGGHNGYPYFAMEYIKGINLKDYLAKKTLPLDHAIEIVYHLSSALNYGSKYKMIHRDIKPANIILPTKSPRHPKLIDFGLAKCLGDTYHDLTKTGSIMGSPYFMSPEQARDSKNVDHRADIYSLGATLYYMLAFKPPFSEYKDSDFRAILDAVLNEEPVPIYIQNSKVPKPLSYIVLKMMAKDPRKRFQDYDELRNALKQFFLDMRKQQA